MSTEIIRTCDRCKKTLKPKAVMWEVGVLAAMRPSSSLPKQINSRAYMSRIEEGYKMDVCKRCLENMGLCIVKEEERVNLPVPPSLEELIEEIAGEAAIQALDNR